VKDLPYILPLVILEAGITLREQKSEKFCWTRQSWFCDKDTPVPQSFHQIADLTKL
jgi:hypothetical protein